MPSEWAKKQTDEIIERWEPIDSIAPLIADALDAARAQGRREGLEEAARIAEIGRKDSLAKIIGTVIAQDIRAAISKEPTA